MTVIGDKTKKRLSRAVRFTEQFAEWNAKAIPRNVHVRTPQPWWGITKERINNGADGDVYVCEGSPLSLTASSTTYYNVANPVMGDLMVGMPVLVVPSIVFQRSSEINWHVAPFFLMYEGKVVSGITAGGSGSVEIWHDSDRNENVTAHLRWVPSGSDAAADAQVRVVWDLFKKRFYVDAMEC